jgi:hypothetical protein
MVVEVEHDGSLTAVGRAELAVSSWSDHRFDLSSWAGQEVRVRFRSEPGATATYDHVFLEGPTLYTPVADPRRVVFVFIDTLRPDHLGLYGYGDAPTSPTLDRWADGGVVYEQARGVAPWTLPSARAALSGAQPEMWFEESSVAERLAAAGFHTEAFVSNAFLSQPFDMHRGWTHFSYTHLQPAAGLVESARGVLDAHADRDVALLVHFMEPHLPYEESWSYRWRFAGIRPSALESLTRHWLFELSPDDPDLPAIRDHVVDRYDANIRVVDDQLLGLLADAGPDATVVLFSDHGEEFWEHGSFEHGHTFFDELIHVPLAIRSPGLPAGRRIAAPVSLLDIAPTVLELEGLPVEARDGASLVPMSWSPETESAPFEARPQAFGRPLYGPDGWGVVSEGHKWWGRGGERQAFDLRTDPGETRDLLESVDETPFPVAMGEALDRDVVLAWRVKLFQRPVGGEVRVRISHPTGIEQAWSAYDPRGRAEAAAPQIEDGEVRIRVPQGSEAPAAIYLVPTEADPHDCRGLEISIRGSGLGIDGVCSVPPSPLGVERQELLKVGDNRWGAVVDLEWAPVPAGVAVSGFDAGLETQLRELGYMDD